MIRKVVGKFKFKGQDLYKPYHKLSATLLIEFLEFPVPLGRGSSLQNNL